MSLIPILERGKGGGQSLEGLVVVVGNLHLVGKGLS